MAIAPGTLTSSLEVCASNTGLVEVLRVHRLQCVEQGVPGGVVASIAQVQTPNEGHQAPLECLLPHVGMGGRFGMAGGAVVAGAPPPNLIQLVFGPVTLAAAESSWAACKSKHSRIKITSFAG